MTIRGTQLDLFSPQSLDPTFELKRHLRLSLSKTNLSREQIADEMNKIASKEGMKKNVSKAVLDNWTKDSDPDRLPSLPWLIIFCRVMNDVSPITTLLRPLGCDLIDERGKTLLSWAEAELHRRKATRRARNALALAEDI